MSLPSSDDVGLDPNNPARWVRNTILNEIVFVPSFPFQNMYWPLWCVKYHGEQISVRSELGRWQFRAGFKILHFHTILRDGNAFVQDQPPFNWQDRAGFFPYKAKM